MDEVKTTEPVPESVPGSQLLDLLNEMVTAVRNSHTFLTEGIGDGVECEQQLRHAVNEVWEYWTLTDMPECVFRRITEYPIPKAKEVTQ